MTTLYSCMDEPASPTLRFSSRIARFAASFVFIFGPPNPRTFPNGEDRPHRSKTCRSLPLTQPSQTSIPSYNPQLLNESSPARLRLRLP